MSRASIIARAVAGPLLAYVTGALILYALLAERWTVPISLGLIALWGIVLAWRRVSRRRRLRPLLVAPPKAMRDVSADEFGVHREAAAQAEDPPDPAELARLEGLLGSRRLVLLVAPRLSGRSRLAHSALRHAFGGYQLLRPPSPGLGRDPPLTRLLSSGVLSLRRRYVLWLDDLALLIQSGFDPRSVERWLAAGRGRVAVAKITPLELQRIKASETHESVSLGRAIEVRVTARARPAAPGSAAGRYLELINSEPPAGELVRLVASLELLGVQARTPKLLQRLLERTGGQPPSEELLERLTGEQESLLVEAHGRLSAHPALLSVLETELAEGVEPVLLDALTDVLETPGLIALAQALAFRGCHDEADHALKCAVERSPGNLQLPLARAGVRLIELRQGESGVSLANPGGWDYREPMGWSQQGTLSAAPLGSEPDPVFNATVPPPETRESFSRRFYRLTVYRGAVRAAVLVFLDALAVFGASAAALTVRGLAQHHHWVDVFDGDLVKLVVPAVAVTIPIAVWLGLYRPDRARAQVSLIILTMTIMSIIVAAVFFVVKADIGSLLALLAMFVAAVVLDSLLRFLYDSVSRRWVKDRDLQPLVLILGSPKEARACARSITSSGRPVQAVAFLSEEENDDPFCRGTYAAMKKRLIELHIAEVVIADRNLELDRKADLIDEVHSLGLDVHFVANDDEIFLGAVGPIGDHGLVHVPAALMSPEALEIKRVADRVLVTLTLPLWGSLILAYAAYSRLMWPDQLVLVETPRVGLGGTVFPTFRLRTRREHPDVKTRGAEASGRIEAFCERYGLDELPQVINVLRGEMSIVGPRPLASADVERLKRVQRRVLSTRPGMTGRWQIEWGEAASTPELRALDAEYLRRWRLTHDLELMIRTPWVIARRRRYLGDSEIRRRLRASRLVSEAGSRSGRAS